MPDSKLKLTRDILVIVCVIILAVLIYIFRTGGNDEKPDLNLGEDIAAVKDVPAGMSPGTPSGMGAHRIRLFPEDTEGVAAVALEQDITWAELHRKANRILGTMASSTEGLEDDEEVKINLKRQAFNEILGERYIFFAAGQFGFDVGKIGDDALHEWAKGYDSAEDRLAGINMPGITLDDQRRLLTRDAVIRLVKETVTRDVENMSLLEKENYFQNWLTENIIKLDIEFHDEKLEEAWSLFSEMLSTPAVKGE